MVKLSAISMLFLAAASAANAQSGRKPEHSGPPAVSTESVPNYSESVPSRRNAARSRFLAASPAVPIPPARPGGTAEAIDGEEVIRIETDLVTIPVSVFDRNGLYIPGLEARDFRIFEDGVEQEIAYFGTTEKPVTVILLLDTSLSTNYKIEEIRQAAAAFVDQLKMHDSVMVVEFDGNVNVLTEATTIRPRIFKAISKADFGYGTSLYDAVDFSLRKKLSKVSGRKAVVLFTDGVDTTSSRSGYDSTVALAEESEAMIFPIYYNTYEWNSSGPQATFPSMLSQIGTRPEDYALGKKYVEELADYTGGRVFHPEGVPGGLSNAFKGIAEELRRQYNIGYIPAQKGALGQRKSIRVRVNRPNLVIRSRDSYIVGSSKKLS